ncbi:MAG: alpha/beta fold hydrolase [Proteobacteria bacterium]|nr:alpha/beta fold hydrolase [Pseudomonadota bacterium]
MNGTKVLAIESWCRARNRAFVRFDYAGHGESEGEFERLTLSDWIGDATAILDTVAEGPQVIVGSSMGAWVMVRLALDRPDRVAGLVGIAAAPDFTEDMMWNVADPQAQAVFLEHKVWRQPSPDGEHETVITLDLIEDGRKHLVLRAPIPVTVPVRLIHGADDRSAPWTASQQLMERLESEDATLTLLKGGHHRLSRPGDIAVLLQTLEALLDQLDAPEDSSARIDARPAR